MTDDEKALDKASKHSALAVLGMAAATTLALFSALPPFVPLVSIPLWGLGALQRLTEKPWIAAGAVAWGVGLAVLWKSPLIGVATAAGAALFVRHWLVLRAVHQRRALPKP